MSEAYKQEVREKYIERILNSCNFDGSVTNLGVILDSLIDEAGAKAERTTFNEIDDLWISLNLGLDRSKEDWDKELTRFSLFMQNRAHEINPRNTAR